MGLKKDKPLHLKKHKGAHLRRLVQSRFNFDYPGRTLDGTPHVANFTPELAPDRPARGPRRLSLPTTIGGIVAMSFLANAERRHREKKKRELRGQW